MALLDAIVEARDLQRLVKGFTIVALGLAFFAVALYATR